MSESEQDTYRVVSHGLPTQTDLGEKTRTQLEAFLGTRGVDAAEVLRELDRTGAATTYFDYRPLGPRTRVEIRRVPRANQQ